VAEVMLRRLHGEPDLSGLPAEESAVVARALARRPEDRWPSCRLFVKSLEVGVRDREDRVNREDLGKPADSPRADRTWCPRQPETLPVASTAMTPESVDRPEEASKAGWRRERDGARAVRGRIVRLVTSLATVGILAVLAALFIPRLSPSNREQPVQGDGRKTGEPKPPVEQRSRPVEPDAPASAAGRENDTKSDTGPVDRQADPGRLAQKGSGKKGIAN